MFYGHGTDNPYDEAVYLILRTLGLPFDVDDQVLDSPLGEQQQKYLEELIDKRINERIPVAYLINEAWFAGLPFYVDQSVLIPRSPLAELIEERFSPWINESDVKRILDIGTGSGSIAIACALALPMAKVDAIDVDDDVLRVAKKNIQNYQLTDQINLLKSDLFHCLAHKRYDLIVANPPYVGKNEISSLPVEYSHEPVKALMAGNDGLAVIREILQQAGHHLTNHGVLIVEVGNSQEAVIDTFPELPFTWLEFEYGGEGVLLLTAAELNNFQQY